MFDKEFSRLENKALIYPVLTLVTLTPKIQKLKPQLKHKVSWNEGG
jgi:hypothetical protein